MAEEPKPIKTERIDNPDGTYTVKEFYEKSLTLAVYDNNDKLLSNEWYKDYDCQEFIGKFWREYNKDNSYIEYCIYEKPLTNQKSQLSEIKQINADNQRILHKIYSDNDFKNLMGTAKFEYNEDGSHVVYTVYEYPQESMKYLSTIGIHNSNRTKVNSKLFSDKNFKDIIADEKREFNDNFTEYYCELIYTKPFQNIYYSSKTFSKQNGEKQIYYYKDKNFSTLAKEYDYSEDGSYIVKYVLEEPNGQDCLSIIGFYNKNNQWLKGLGYSDNNFQNLAVTMNVNLIDSSITTIYETPCVDGNVVATVKYENSDGSIKEEKHYKDKDMQILYLTINFEHNPKYIIEKWQYSEVDSKGIQSSLRYINTKNEKYIKCEYFNDKKFTVLDNTCFVKYYKNNHIRLYNYTKPYANGYYTQIEKYDNDNNLIYSKNYKCKGVLAHILFLLAR